MTRKTLRQLYRPLITKVLIATKGQPRKEVRAALHDAFPHPPHKYWPWKIWLDEVRRQTGEKKHRPRPPEPGQPGQLALFDTEDDDESDT